EVERVRDKNFNELEATAQTVASGFNYAFLEPLTFTVNDTGNVVFNHITEQLQVMASHHEHIQIYTMVKRDSLIVFGPCSQHTPFSLPTLPGQVYQYPPDGLAAVFDSGRSLLVDPYKDEYGYYVSAYAPVFLPLS